MSMKYLGETFDLHAGGMDLQFPHHENEIAQSEGATGKLFAKYWIHSEFLKIDDVTMSKSKGNFFTFRDLRDQGYSPLAIRYLLLSVPYRKQLNFTFEGLQGAESTVERLRNFRKMVKATVLPPGSEWQSLMRFLNTSRISNPLWTTISIPPPPSRRCMIWSAK